MNQLIDSLSKTQNHFTYKILDYVLENFQPDYLDFLNNLFIDSTFDNSKKFEGHDIIE